MSELLPCPFCGGEARLQVCSYPGGDRYRVGCTDGGATTWPRIIDAKAAARVWNRRTPADASSVARKGA